MVKPPKTKMSTLADMAKSRGGTPTKSAVTLDKLGITRRGQTKSSIPTTTRDGIKYAPQSILNDRKYVLSDHFATSIDPLANAIERYWVDTGAQIKFQNKGFVFDFDVVEESASGINTLTQEIKVKPSEDLMGSATTTTAKLREFDFFKALNELELLDTPPEYESFHFNQFSPIEYPSRHDNRSRVNCQVTYVYNYESPTYETLITPADFNETQCFNFYKDYSEIYAANNTIGGIDTYLQQNTPSNTAAKNFIIGPSKLEKMKALNENLLTNTKANKISLPFYAEIDIQTIQSNLEDPSVSKIIYDDDEKDAMFYDIASYCADILSSGANPEFFTRREMTNNNYLASYRGPQQKTIDLNYSVGADILNMIGSSTMVNNILDEKSPSSSPDSKSFWPVIYDTSDYIVTESLDGVDSSIDGTLSGKSKSTMSSLYSKGVYTGGFASGGSSGGYYETYSSSGTRADTGGGTSTKPTAVDNEGFEDLRDEIERLILARSPSAGEKAAQSYYYTDVLNNSKPYYQSTVILYRIAKFEAGNLEEPIQNIWVPKDPNITGSFKYIDFQVKYGKEYVYKVFAYKFVLGVRYSYNISRPTDGAYYGDTIKDYYKNRNLILAVAAGMSSTYYFDSTMVFFKQRLQEAKSGKKKDNISSQKETLAKPAKKDSQWLRYAISALTQLKNNVVKKILYKGTQNIAEVLKNELASDSDSGTGYVVATSSSSTTAAVEELETLSTQIDNLKTSLEDLLGVLNGVLSNKHGLRVSAGDSTSQEDKADSILDDIADLLKLEKNTLDLLLGVTKLEVDPDYTPGCKIINAATSAMIDLVEIPYYEESGAVLDSPPLYPDVNFVSYKGKDKAISLFLNSGIGFLEEPPVIFNAEQASYIALYRRSQKLNEVEPIVFASDETANMAKNFEIYRVAAPPQSYGDFENSLLQSISESFRGGKESLSSTSYLDKIKPNQTYYYMFRVVDRRGAASNPSPIFSVKLVNDGGVIFPLIEQYEVPDAEQNYSRPLKKLLNISPSLTQVIPQTLPGDQSYTSYADKNNVNDLLGQTDERIFGKVFKIRFTSKSTGKQIDLNLTFESEILSS